MQQLQDAVVAAFQKMAAEGKIDEMIEKHLAETIDRIICDILRNYSDFGKALQKKIETDLNIDLSKLSFDGYNDVVLKILSRKLNHIADETIKKQMTDFLGKLLQEPPAEIRLSTLMEDFMECHEEEARDQGWDSPSLHVESSDSRFIHVYIDKVPDKDKYECAYSMMIFDGNISNVKIEGKDVAKTMFIGPLYDFDKLIFQLYAAKTNIIVDIEDGDICYPGCD